MLAIKKGVDLRLLSPQMAIAAAVADSVYTELGVPCVITSGRDSKHGAGSLHYLGHGLDFRIRDMTANQAINAAQMLRDRLGPQYDVVLENDHIHTEFDPK